MWTKIVAGRACARSNRYRRRDYRSIWNTIAIRPTVKADAAASSRQNHIRFGKFPRDRYSRGSVPSVWKLSCRFPVRCRVEKPNAPKQKYEETCYRKTAQKRPTPERRHSATLRNYSGSLKR